MFSDQLRLCVGSFNSLLGDRDANLGRAIAILDCCKNADIQNVSFAAIREGPGGGP